MSSTINVHHQLILLSSFIILGSIAFARIESINPSMVEFDFNCGGDEYISG